MEDFYFYVWEQSNEYGGVDKILYMPSIFLPSAVDIQYQLTQLPTADAALLEDILVLFTGTASSIAMALNYLNVISLSAEFEVILPALVFLSLQDYFIGKSLDKTISGLSTFFYTYEYTIGTIELHIHQDSALSFSFDYDIITSTTFTVPVYNHTIFQPYNRGGIISQIQMLSGTDFRDFLR